MMPVNSNGIFRIIIVCSLFCLGFGSFSHQMSFSSSGNLRPMISSSLLSSNNGVVRSSHVEFKDGKLTVSKYDSDNLSGEKKQTVLINDEKKEFKDSVSTSDQQVPNKYFCNETSYSKICASINPDSYYIKISDTNLENNFKIPTIPPYIKNENEKSHYQDKMKENVELKSTNLEKRQQTALKLQLENFENQRKIQVVDTTNQEEDKNTNDHLEKEKDNTLANIKLLLLSQSKYQESNNKLSQVDRVNSDKEKMLSEYLEIKKKYNESLESLITCENRVETLNTQMTNLTEKLFIEKSADNEQLKNEIIYNVDQPDDLETNIETTDGPKLDECEDLKEKHSIELLELQDEIRKLKNDNGECMNEQSRLKRKLKYAQRSKLWERYDI